MEEHGSLWECERDASTHVLEKNSSRGLDESDSMNSTKDFERNCELENCKGLRHQKRKQEIDNIYQVSTECAPTSQPLSSQQCINDARIQEYQQNPAGFLQVCEMPRSPKRKRETIDVHEVGLNIILRTDGSCSLQALGFDIKASSSVAAVGVKHASCSILSDQDVEQTVGATLATGVVNNKSVVLNKKKEKGTDICEELRVTTAEASGVDVCSMFTTKGEFVKAAPLSLPDNCKEMDEPKATLPFNCKGDQAESEKLQMAVAALHSQFTSLYNLAESGSKGCGHCQSIKNELSKLLSNYCDTFISQVSPKQAAAPMQGLASKEALMCSSPVGSSRVEETAQEKEACKRHVPSVENINSSVPLEMALRCKSFETNVHGDVHEGCTLKPPPLLTERACNLEHTSLEENQDCAGELSRQVEVNLETAKLTDSFHGVEEGWKGEELSGKSSKEEDCLNSGITRDAIDPYLDKICNQAEKDGFIDYNCGCTSQKFGDTMGIMRIYRSRKPEIQCQCSMECIKGNPMSPADFERHGGRGASKKWMDSIWLVVEDQRVQFSKVPKLVRLYKELGRTTACQPALPKQSSHRDEFLQCTKCSKRRRFRQKTKSECRLFHEASMNLEWECSNYPFESLSSCQDEEEREVRQTYRGCVRLRTCKGCIECVCVGCFTCRFEDCKCRLCTEYIANNK